MKGLNYMILTGMCLGTTGMFVKLIGPDVSPFLLASIRILFAAVLILAFLTSERKTSLLNLRDGDLHIFLLAGFFGVVMGFGFFVKAMTMIPVSNAIFLVFIYPIVTSVLAKVFLDERLGRYTILALVMSFLGIFLIYGQGMSAAHAEGSMYALSAGLGYSVFIVSMRHMEKKGHSFWDVLFWPLLFGGIMLLPISATESITFLPYGDTMLWLAGLVLLSTFLAYIFYARALETIQAKHATIIETLVEPATAIFLAWLFLGETIPEYIFLGGLLIIIGNLLARMDLADEESHRKRI